MNKHVWIYSFKVKEGKMPEAIEVLKEMALIVKNSIPGLLEYNVYTVRGPKNKNKLIFYEKFEGEAVSTRIDPSIMELFKKLNQYLEPKSQDMNICVEIV